MIDFNHFTTDISRSDPRGETYYTKLESQRTGPTDCEDATFLTPRK